MFLSNYIKFKVVFTCLVVFVFSGCSMIIPPERWAESELYGLCDMRYKYDNAEIALDSFAENKKNIDVELKKRGKNCGCYYQAWSKSNLYMGLIGMGLQANTSKHCENDNPKEAKENTSTPSE
jgi:hypothetical protein